METKSERVRAAVAACDLWYLTRKRDLRAESERLEALWMEVDHHTNLLEQAEADGNTLLTAQHLDRVLEYVLRVQDEVQRGRGA